MKLKRLLTFIITLIFAIFLVACGSEQKEETKKEDPLTPKGISLKIKTAKVQINKTIKLTYTITPSTAQGDAVTVTLDNDLVTTSIEGKNAILITAKDQVGNVRVTVTTSNGIKATKTIKVQLEEVANYPDLSGYNIKIAQSEPTLGELDVKLSIDTRDKYDYYEGSDKEYLSQAWDEIEDNYNCTITVGAYPSDAPWGPSRWQYILSQAQNEAAEFDFYVTPDGQIPGYVSGNAVQDLTDWYAEYGKNIMSDMAITSGTYKKRLYSINPWELNVYCLLGYNIGLLEKLQQYDATIQDPAQMYLDDNWNYDTFKEYCYKVQTALNTLYGETEDSYYCLSGYGTYYWRGMVNAAGIKVLDTTQLKVNLTGVTETLAAQTLQEIYAAGAMDPAFQVDGSVATWNQGHSLFNTGDYWFYQSPLRWTKTLWGNETRYGFVPFPTSPESDHVYIGLTLEYSIVMATGRDWAYKGFGEDCTPENIYRAYMDYWTTAKQYYTSSEDYSKLDEVTTIATDRFGNETSVKAYIKAIMGVQQPDGTYINGLDELGFFDPYVEDSNPVVGNYGASGTLAGDINVFIKSGDASAQWIDAVGSYQATVEKALVDAYG